MPTAWLIRHGESEANAGLPSENPADVPLTDRGFTQSAAVAERFDFSPTLIVTSPYLRTAQTAQKTIARFPHTPQQEWPVQEFTFLAPARCAHTTLAERRPMVEEYWERGERDYIDGEGAESFADLLDRVWRLKDRVQQCDDNAFLAIFSHAQFLRAVIWALFFMPTKDACLDSMLKFRRFFQAVDIPNCGIIEWQLQANGEMSISSVRSAHLSSSVCPET